MSILFIFILFMCAIGTSLQFVILFPVVPCTYPRGEDCVELRKCPYFDNLLNISPYPRTKSVIDEIRANQCDFRENRPYVCCERNITVSTAKPITEIVHEKDSLPDTFFGSIITHRNYHLLPQSTCGRTMISGRITNGMETDINEFPWMALIAYKLDVSSDVEHGVVFKCAGTVINERFVLTAAHCISKTMMVGVRLGEYDMDQSEDCDTVTKYCAPPNQDFLIDFWVIHPNYNKRYLFNDIALIKLNRPADFSFANVQPICLPIEDVDLNGKNVVVAGWGITEKGIRSSVLTKVELPVVQLPSCQKIYEKFAPVTDAQICAGGISGKDSCAGDSGGPLKGIGSINGTTKFIQYGIVSYGPKQCGSNGIPGIYTKVFIFMGWILDQLDT